MENKRFWQPHDHLKYDIQLKKEVDAEERRARAIPSTIE
jgi:hypothetical protein